jgi:hypothetical protein
MIIYHGAVNKDIRLATKQKINCLVTYAAYKKHEWQPWWKNLFIDSGAFSVHNSGKTIDIKKYAEYLLEWESMKKPIVYASLDVIGDEKESYKNYKYLLKKKLNPMPCFHYGESFDVLRKYADMTNVIGLGALVGLSTGRRRLFLDQVFSLYPDPTKIGFHGFGVTSPPLIKQYPWYSIDSTMAMRWAMFGQLLTPWGRYTAMNSIARSNHITSKLGSLSMIKMKEWLKSFGADWDIMLAEGKEGQMMKEFINIQSLEELKVVCPSSFKGTSKNSFSLLGQ